MFTMAPPPDRRMAGTACFMPRKTPLALTFMMESHSVVLVTSEPEEPLMPALFTRMSSRPEAATASRATAPPRPPPAAAGRGSGSPGPRARGVAPGGGPGAAVAGDLGRPLLAGRLAQVGDDHGGALAC